MISKYFLFILVFGLLSCSGSIPSPNKEQISWASQKWTGTSEETLLSGRQQYIVKCSGCHSLKIPMSYTEMQWDTIMQKMGPTAKLSSNEYQNIIKYVTTVIKKYD